MSCECQASYIGPSLANTCYGGSFALFMSILDTLIRNTCDLSEICERVTPKLQPDLEYDFVVIGGGAAGSVAAARLSEVPEWKVLLIEAGGDEPPGSQVPSMMNNFHGNYSIDWNYKTEPQTMACLAYPEQRCTWPRGKVLGGSGVLNGMMYIRGLPSDYDAWKEMGNSGWGYDDVLPYFKRVEGNQQIGTLVSRSNHGADGPMTVSRFPNRPELADDVVMAVKELGYSVVDDLNSEPFQGFTIAQATIRNGSRLSGARAFLRPARNRPNLHIMLNSTATKILLNTTNNQKQVSEVQFIFQNQTYIVKVKREVVLSAGSINSPHILLLSGIGPKENLEEVNISQVHDLPGVGKNFKNHVSFSLNFRMNLITSKNNLDWVSVREYLQNRNGSMSSTGMAQVTARICSKSRLFCGPSPDLQLFFAGCIADCSRFGAVGEVQDVDNPFSPRNFSILPVVLRPKSVGYIKLSSKDPLNPPLMNPNYLSEEEDVETLIKGIRIAQKLARTNILTNKYGPEVIREDYMACVRNNSYDSDQFWKCAVRYYTGPENHQSGSCKMGPSSDGSSVVDSKLQVYGIEGLRVMDASVIPTPISGNTHATVVMIAEKGVDHIKEKWLRGSQ